MLKRALASIVGVAIISVLGVSPASASSVPGPSGAEKAVVAALDSATPIDDLQVSRLLSGVVAPTASGAARTGEQLGWKLSSGESIVALQLDDGGINLSAQVLTFSPAAILLSSTETYFVLDGSSLSATQWKDGKKVAVDRISASSVRGIGPVAPRGASVNSFHFSITKFNDCLASKGVAWWVVAMVSSVCGIVGVSTAGVGFIACAVGTLGISSGVAGYCFGVATK